MSQEGREQRAEAAATASVAEAEALQQEAVEHIAARQAGEARSRLRRALALHLAAGRTRDAGGARYMLALLEGRLEGDPGAATALLEAALADFLASGERGMAGRCRLHLAALALGRGDAAAADACYAAAAEDLAAAGDRGREQQAIIARITTLQLLSRPAEALALTGRLLALAEGDAGASLEARLARLPLLRAAPGSAELPVDSLDRVLADAEAQGMLSLGGQARLSRAAERQAAGDPAGALADVEAARQAALGVPDPVLYLLACLSLAELHEARGDRVACLSALFTCQASLFDLLGEQARTPVLWVIAARRRRWGEPEWQRVIGLYRAQFA